MNSADPESHPTIGPDNSAQFALLRLLEQHPEYSQRQLAVAMNVSLGKAHYLMKALLGKGWVKANSFRRSDNKWAYAYLLTPSGVLAKLRLTRDFLARKEGEFERLKREIAALHSELQHKRDTT
jgi:EPS-associated MarR family transcriptional regulator